MSTIPRVSDDSCAGRENPGPRRTSCHLAGPHSSLLPTPLPVSSIRNTLFLDLPKALLKRHILWPTAKAGPQALSLSINDLSWLTLQL